MAARLLHCVSLQLHPSLSNVFDTALISDAQSIGSHDRRNAHKTTRSPEDVNLVFSIPPASTYTQLPSCSYLFAYISTSPINPRLPTMLLTLDNEGELREAQAAMFNANARGCA
jgi:hypothetical protein